MNCCFVVDERSLCFISLFSCALSSSGKAGEACKLNLRSASAGVQLFMNVQLVFAFVSIQLELQGLVLALGRNARPIQDGGNN